MPRTLYFVIVIVAIFGGVASEWTHGAIGGLALAGCIIILAGRVEVLHDKLRNEEKRDVPVEKE